MKSNGHIRNWIRFLALGFALMLVSQSDAYSQAKVGSNDGFPLSLSNSARALALGGAASTLVDEYSGLHNPGALALFYLVNHLSVTAPLSADTWPDISFKSFAVGAGWLFNPAGGRKHSPKIVLAGSYTQAVLDIQILQTTYSDPYGQNPPTFFTMSNLVDYFSLSFGVEYFAQAGIGATLRRERSLLEEFESPWIHHVDFGVNFSIPLREIFRSGNSDDGSRNRVFVDLSVAFVSLDENLTAGGFSIVNGTMIRINPRNRTSRIGASLSWGVGNAHVNHLSIRALYDRLTNPVPVFLGSLLSLQKEQNMYGIELGLKDALFVRTGRSIEQDANQWGVGVNFRRLVQTVIPGSFSQSAGKSSILQAVNLRIDIAHVNRNSNLLDDFTYVNVALSFGR